MHFHRNTVIYRINKIKLITGLDPRNFWDLVELVKRVPPKEGVTE